MSLSILVVDDDLLLLKTIDNLLQKEGYDVTCVAIAREALEKVKTHFYPLIILDVKMPDMDGIELLERIREFQSGEERSRAIIITGYADDDVPIKAIKLEASDYLMKPFELPQFLYSVHRAVKIGEMEMEKEEYLQIILNKSQALKETLLELQAAKKDLEDYSNTLEMKVEERTAQLKAAQAQLIQSAKMVAVGQLGAGIAHELNNPLVGVLGYAQLVLEKLKAAPTAAIQDKETLEKFVKHIEKETIRCKEIVESLLKFSRVPAPLPGHTEAVDILNVIQETRTLLDRMHSLRTVRLTIESPPELAKVKGGSNHLQQVFANLFMNAQEAMGEGGEVKIKMSNRIDPATKIVDSVQVEIADSGSGIPPENIGRVFEPFFTTKAKGTGLGLSIVYQIIHDHNGTIEVESRGGQGACFKIVLPAWKAV